MNFDVSNLLEPQAARGTGAAAVGAAPSAEDTAALASSLATATGATPPPPTPGSTVVDTTIEDPNSLSSAEVGANLTSLKGELGHRPGHLPFGVSPKHPSDDSIATCETDP